MTEIKRESTSGPKINPSGPKKIIPPKIENNTNNAGTSKPFPKK